VINLRLPGRVSRGFREGLNTCPEHAQGCQTWPEFRGLQTTIASVDAMTATAGTSSSAAL
jgi:hypothetical protein